jgi:glucose/mannose-6-phosphate isomerase
VGIYNDIKNFNKQFAWEPQVENPAKLRSGASAEKSGRFKKFIVAGMGGSHLAADLIRTWKPDADIIVWSNYGLPPLPQKELRERLIIASSYSGNTEETIDAFELALKKKLSVAAMASGGKLITMAHILKVPHVVMPSHMQPRMALGYSLKAVLKLMGENYALQEVSELVGALHPSRREKEGKNLARKLKGQVPIIYSSFHNRAIAYNWKIKFNETGKIPAFYNVLPEMNHNEMTGFDVKRSTARLSRNFHFIFLKDREDLPRIAKRMNMMFKIFTKRGFRTEVLSLYGKNVWEKIFSSLNLADWTAYYTAKLYNVEPEEVPMVEEFKKLIAGEGK